MSPLSWIALLMVLVKISISKRGQAKLRAEVNSNCAAITAGVPFTDEKQDQQSPPAAPKSNDPTPAGELTMKHTLDAKAMLTWVNDTAWWVVKGPTGSGKSYFVEKLVTGFSATGQEFVFVPQYPMFKPQLPVMRFLNLLPLSKDVRDTMIKSLDEMEVPRAGLIGGALYGMLNLPGLSGGQRKKLYIAMTAALAIQFKCKCIFMDEPFAGINPGSMVAVLEVLKKAEAAVPGLKFVVVTHDHFDMFADSSSILRVVDRNVIADNGFAKPNVEASEWFLEALMAISPSSSIANRPFIDTYVIKRYFLEQEFGLPLFAYVTFAVLLGLTVLEYNGGLPGIGYDVVYTFMKCFALEFPHFASVINYCFKRGQHMEDYYLGVTRSKYAVVELVIVSLIQACVLVPLFTAILCGISNFWWVNIDVALIDLYYESVSTIGYFLLPILSPNPILAMAGILPYVCVWGFTNGITFPKNDMWGGTKWTSTFSPIYNLACAYKEVGEGKLIFYGTECFDSLALHVFLSSTFTWVVMLACLIKLALGRLRRKTKKDVPRAPSAPTESATLIGLPM